MESLRIDKWLWFARFFKSRGLAQRLVEEGDVRLNDRAVGKTSIPVQPGDEVTFRQGRGWRRVLVLELGNRRGPATEAQALYRELPPPPPADDWA